MRFRRGRRLGKYQIVRLLGEGGSARVYEARDSIEGIPVAMKVFPRGTTDSATLNIFRQELRIAARLDHENILPVKDANIFDDHLVIVSRLATSTLAERLRSRLSVRKALEFTSQMLTALAHAHERRVIHCDIKPENFLLFPDGTLRLADFGIARFALRTVQGSGSGTVGYVAPEQAMGKPGYRSDVFSAALLIWRMLSGRLPEWPFEPPLLGHDKLRRTVHEDLSSLLGRCLSVAPGPRPADATVLQAAFERILPRAIKTPSRLRSATPRQGNGRSWRDIRFRQFQRIYKKELDTRHECPSCSGPVAESMRTCPWCSRQLKKHRGTTRLARSCPRCCRGMKPDWRFCAYCWGPRLAPNTNREYADKHYEGRCAKRTCSRKVLFRFSRYCPWCHAKVQKKWKLEASKERCSSCGWGVTTEFWNSCPWCAAKLSK